MDGTKSFVIWCLLVVPFSAAFHASNAMYSSRLFKALYAGGVVDLEILNIQFPRPTQKVEPIFDIVAQRDKWMQSLYAEEEETTKVLSKSFGEKVVPVIKDVEKIIPKPSGGASFQLPRYDLKESLQPFSAKISQSTTEGISKGSEEVTNFLVQIWKVDPVVVNSVKAYVAENPNVVAGAALFLILLGVLQPTEYRDDSEPSMIVEALKNKSVDPIEPMMSVTSKEEAPVETLSEEPIESTAELISSEVSSLKEELRKRDEEISELKKAMDESMSNKADTTNTLDKAKIVEEITAQVTQAADRKYKLQEEQLKKSLEDLKKREESLTRSEATTLHAVKQFLVETNEMPQGTANLVLTSTIPQVLRDVVRKTTKSKSDDELSKMSSKLAEMELYLKEKTAENEQLKLNLLGSDETLGASKKDSLLRKKSPAVVESGVVSDLKLDVEVAKERIVISNPSDSEIKLSEGYTIADSYPSTKVNLVLPSITVPAGKSLTVFTCPGKEAYARPKSFRGKYIEWKTASGDLKKSRLFTKDKAVPVFLYSADGSKI